MKKKHFRRVRRMGLIQKSISVKYNEESVTLEKSVCSNYTEEITSYTNLMLKTSEFDGRSVMIVLPQHIINLNNLSVFDRISLMELHGGYIPFCQ